MRNVVLILLISLPWVLFSQTPDWQWISSGGGNGTWVPSDPELDDRSTGIVTDKFGNTTVCGQIFEASLPKIAGVPMEKYGGKDGFVAQYDCNGNLRWAFTFGASKRDEATDIAIDSFGNVYVVGHFIATSQVTDSVYFSDTTFKINGQHAFIAKLDTLGKVQWLRLAYGANTGVFSNSLALDIHSNNIGYLLISSGWFKEFSPGDSVDAGFLVARYDLNGNLKEVNKLYDGIYNKLELRDISIDKGSNSFVVGTIYDSINIQGSAYTISSVGEVIVLKFDTLGTHVWGTKSNIPSGSGVNHGFEIRTFDTWPNSFYLAGTAKKGTLFGNHEILNSWIGNTGFLVKYVSGTADWLVNVKSSKTANANNYLYCLDLDHSQNVYIGGHFEVEIRFGNDTLKSVGIQNPYFAIIDKYGNYQYSKTIPASGSNRQNYPFGIVSGYNGNVFVTGTFESNITLPVGTAIKNGGNTDFFVIKYGIEECEDTTITPIDTSDFISEYNPNQSINVFPNPSQGRITIVLDEMTKGTLSIYNSLGSEVFNSDVSRNGLTEVDLPAYLNDGVYFIRIVQQNQIRSSRFVLKSH